VSRGGALPHRETTNKQNVMQFATNEKYMENRLPAKRQTTEEVFTYI